ncbi:MAG: hypothetical protein JXB88_26420, partial [Spirochaetales bacterium]|nr:hypothetical protein [Spirochaetales bacterium]
MSIIILFLFYSPVAAETDFFTARGLRTGENNTAFFCKDTKFLSLIPSFSLVSEDNDPEYTDEDEKKPPDNETGEVFLHIVFTYILPVSYFSLSLILKEFVFTGARENNPLVYINPVVSSVFTFGAAGFFTGLVLGITISDDGVIDTFLYSTMLGFLTGIAGMLAGGIYAMIEYNT